MSLPIDHFNFHGTLGNFSLRYLISDHRQHALRPLAGCAAGSPVLFYTGNEGAIELFYRNTGFVTETLAKEFGGSLVVFAEHRYYGKSMPFRQGLLPP